ncbi:MAG TPA: hypothetical protein VFK69_10565 [Candidatus Eisenbacteria bacterium]|nr:hypothetical protein [Candidatus Eisenbacteria bacterium]
MRRSLAVALVLLAAPALAHAGGYNIAWGQSCWPDNPVSAKTFACNSNIGHDLITLSFVPDGTRLDFGCVELTLEFNAGAATLPAWWQFFNTGACRQNALAASANFTPFISSCADPWGGQAANGIFSYKTQANDATVPADAGRVTAFAVLPIGVEVDAGVEYDALFFSISHVKTIGTGACAGCTTPMAVAVRNFQYGSTSGPDHTLTSAINNTCLTWQGAVSPCAPVPAHNLSWGRIKSLYR